MRAAPVSDDDWRALEFEAGQLFSPSTPISENDLFAGRGSQILKLIETTQERGKHAILFGERGVGKTSLAKIFHTLFPSTVRHIFSSRVQVTPIDDFSSIWKSVFKDIQIEAVRKGEGEVRVPLASFYESQITPDDVRRELEVAFKPSDIPIIIIDEYDKLKDGQSHELMANTIKALSDYGVNVTVVIVGVADNVNELIGEHKSIARCLEQIPMPRMDVSERKEILRKIIPRLGVELDKDAQDRIVSLSKGLPSYVHSLGQHSTQNAIRRRSLQIETSDVEKAIGRVLERSQESIQEAYAKAIHSNRSDSLYREVLLACALADTDDRGTFAPLSVCKPLTKILGRESEVEIAAFQQHLKKFISEERGEVLVRKGRERAYRFRFSDPLMQPYVIMKGLHGDQSSRIIAEVLSRLPS